jgi:hypothetical protein
MENNKNIKIYTVYFFYNQIIYMDIPYKQKYIKYKKKYLYLQKQIGGFNKMYDFINYILGNTFLSFKESKPTEIIRSLIQDCITLIEILSEACVNIEEKNPEVISVPQQKAELDIIKKRIKFIDFDFLQNILEFSLLDTDNLINLEIGELIWHHLTFFCEKYFYLLNLYKKYKIPSTILYFNDDGIFDLLCSSFDNNQKCLKIDNLCEWKDEKCLGKKEKDEPSLFNYDRSEDSDQDSCHYSYQDSYNEGDDHNDCKIDTPPKFSNLYYNTKLMNILRENFPFNFIQFFLNTNFIKFKERSNRNKEGQYDLIRFLGNNSEDLFQNIENSIEEISDFKKISIIRDKTFFEKEGVDKKDIDYYLNDPDNLIYKFPLRHEDWINGKNIRFYNTELYEILEYGLQKDKKYNPILHIYWIHMQYLCKKYYYLIHLYEKYKIPFTKKLVDINKVCINMKDKSKCNQSEFCNWNERGEINKQCEIKPIKWNYK